MKRHEERCALQVTQPSPQRCARPEVSALFGAAAFLPLAGLSLNVSHLLAVDETVACAALRSSYAGHVPTRVPTHAASKRIDMGVQTCSS